MDTFIDKLAQKKNAQEMIKANMTAEAAKMEQLQNQMQANDGLMQEIRKVNLKTVENVAEIRKALETCIEKLDALQADSSQTEQEQETLTEIKNLLEEKFRQSEDFMHKENVKVYRNVQAVVLGQDGADRLAEKGLHSREELVERVRDTFVPKRDSFEKLKVKDLSGCECYANYQITTPLPKSLFGDSFGYEMQKDIGKHMEAYYAGKMDDEELGQYFNACCTEMRKYQAQCHRASGDAEADNRKIISQVYEIFA